MADNKDNRITVSARMSHRLIEIAEMCRNTADNTIYSVDDCSARVMADVGCDHGYVSIYLAQSGIADRVIAMDVRKGPLSGAENNIRDYGLSDRIETRLSDGLAALEPGNADSMVIAGMGGKLMMRILEDGDPVRLGIRGAVLQPQSDIDEFREYLRQKGYFILDEKVILDEGKYYFPMQVSFDGRRSTDRLGREHDYLQEATALLTDKTGCTPQTAAIICNRFGECNILRKDELLRDFCKHGATVTRSILTELEGSGHNGRIDALKKELAEIECVLSILD